MNNIHFLSFNETLIILLRFFKLSVISKFIKKALTAFLVIVAIQVSFAGCGSDGSEGADSSTKDITQFTIMDIDGVINENTISVILPYGTDKINLIPTITHTGASISPASGVPQNFTNSVIYTVTAADSSTSLYEVRCLSRCNVSWIPNREKAVNSTGGGYTVYYSNTDGFNIEDSGVASIDVPYVSGIYSPTSTPASLTSGTWYFRIRAYSALNGGSVSGVSDQSSVIVP